MIFYAAIIASLLALLWWAREKSGIDFAAIGNYQVLLPITGQALILALQAGVIAWAWLLRFPQDYIDFISGSVGFAGSNKSAELYALVIAIAAFVLAFLLLAALYSAALERGGLRRGITTLAIYSLIPAAIMAGQSVRLDSTSNLLMISAIFIVLFLAVLGVMIVLTRRGIISPEEIFPVGSKLLLGAVFLALSETGGAVFFSRIGVLSYVPGIVTSLLICIYIVVLRTRRGPSRDFSGKLDLAVSLSQFGMSFLFFILASPPVRLQNGIWTFFPYRPALSILVWGLAVVAILDIYRRSGQDRTGDGMPFSMISPWALVAVLVFCQSSPVHWPAVSVDDFHASEFYLPWWLLTRFHYLPFAGYEPARGMVNYIPGLLSWLFYDNSFSGQSMVSNMFAASYVFLAFFALRSIAGNLVAFVAVFSLCVFIGEPAGGIVLAMAFLAILFTQPRDRHHLRTFLLWIGLSLFATSFMVAEGGVFAIGTFPLGIWLLVRAYRHSRSSLLIALGTMIVAAALLLVATNAEPVILSAVRYVFEQSAVNNIANGIAWQYPGASIGSAVTSGYLWQIVRFSWVLLLVPLTIQILRGDRNSWSDKYWGCLIALFIMVILIVPRAAGRIDPVSYSRPAQTSLGFILCGLPFVLLPALSNEPSKAITVLLMAIVFGLLGNQEPSLATALSLSRYTATEPQTVISGKDYGLHNLGDQVVMDSGQLRRQISIEKTLRQLLKPRETYYDATNHSSDYGFQGRPSPVVDVAFYNAPTEQQQVNAVKSLETKEIPLALVQAENVPSDGGTLALRCFWIYRFLITKFVPFQDKDGHIWMVRNDQTGRMARAGFQFGSPNDSLQLLSEAFWQRDLAALPASWGNSLERLRDKLTNPVDLLVQGRVLDSHGMHQTGPAEWMVTGPDPYFVLGMPSGTKGDELLIVADRKIPGDFMRVYWTNNLVPTFSEGNSFIFSANSASFVVPVSTAPSWYLSGGIEQLRIDPPNGFQGVLKFHKIILYDRTP